MVVLLFVACIAVTVVHCSHLWSEASRIHSEQQDDVTVQEPLQRIPESELPVGESRR